MWTNIMFSIIGFTGGLAVACGIFALLVKLGVFTRIIEIARTAKNIRMMESCILLGGTFGSIVSVFAIPVPIGVVGLVVFGIFGGMYVGWLHMALAETLSLFPVAFRRLKLKYGLGLAIFFLGLGKLLGALIYFYNGWGNIP